MPHRLKKRLSPVTQRDKMHCALVLELQSDAK